MTAVRPGAANRHRCRDAPVRSSDRRPWRATLSARTHHPHTVLMRVFPKTRDALSVGIADATSAAAGLKVQGGLGARGLRLVAFQPNDRVALAGPALESGPVHDPDLAVSLTNVVGLLEVHRGGGDALAVRAEHATMNSCVSAMVSDGTRSRIMSADIRGSMPAARRPRRTPTWNDSFIR